MKKTINTNILQDMGLTRQNLMIFVVGLITILLGYLALGIGDTYDMLSLTIGPILLVFGYVIILPLAILYKSKEEN